MSRYLSNLFWLLSDRVFMMVFQLSLFASIKRLYGLEVLGGWATLNNISQLLLSVFLFGIDIVVVKKIIDKPSCAGREIGSAIFLQFLGLLVYALIFLFITLTFYKTIPSSLNYALILISANFLSLFAKFIFFHYSALVESKYRAITILTSVAISYGFLWFSIYNEFYIFYSYVFFYFVQALISIYIYINYFPAATKWLVDIRISKNYFRVGLKLIISTVSVSLFTQCDVILLEYFSGAEETGAFSAALRLSAIWFMLGGLIANAFFPKIVELEKISQTASFIFIKWISGIVCAMSIYAALISTVLSGFIMKLLYGNGMELSAQIFSIHMWSGIFIFLGSFSSKWLFSKEYINFEVQKTLLAALLNITLNLIVIPKYGAIGAAIVSLFSYFVANLLFFACTKKTRGIFYVQAESFKYVFLPWLLVKDYGKVKCQFQ